MAIKTARSTRSNSYSKLAEEFRLSRIKYADHLKAAHEMIDRRLQQDPVANTGDGTRTHDLRIMRPPASTFDSCIISAIQSTSENITGHHEPSYPNGLRSGAKTAFQPLIAPVDISGHQGDSSEYAPALLPKTLPSDSDLTAIVDAWDGLPEELKAAIVAMVRDSKI